MQISITTHHTASHLIKIDVNRLPLYWRFVPSNWFDVTWQLPHPLSAGLSLLPSTRRKLRVENISLNRGLLFTIAYLKVSGELLYKCSDTRHPYFYHPTSITLHQILALFIAAALFAPFVVLSTLSLFLSASSAFLMWITIPEVFVTKNYMPLWSNFRKRPSWGGKPI